MSQHVTRTEVIRNALADRIEPNGRLSAEVAAELAGHIDDELLRAHTVTTVEELDQLPNGVVVRSAEGTIACRFDATRGVVFGDDRPFPWLRLV